MPTVLLTGFEPFDGDTSNPSWTAVQEVRDRWDGDAEIQVRQLPVDFEKVDDALLAALAEVAPDVVISVGLAGGIETLEVERVAINVDDARIPDNTGFQPIDEPVVDGGPAAYFSTLPIKAAVSAVRTKGIPAVVSQTAGTYTCNHVFYLRCTSCATARAPAAASSTSRTRRRRRSAPTAPTCAWTSSRRPSRPWCARRSRTRPT